MTMLHDNPSSVSKAAQGCVLAIGNFDGVHLGHRALIAAARATAKQSGAPLGVMTFEPHPRQFFQKDGEPFRLTLLPMKQRLMQELGVDHLFSFNFDAALAQLGADAFIDHILVKKLGARHIVVGEDFAFGKGRGGTVETLRSASAAGKFGLTIMPAVTGGDGKIYSSTAVRADLKEGLFGEARNKLGWSWQMEAPVVHGDKRGRTLGYPTANQNMPDYVRIPFGIYAVRILIDGEEGWRNGVANFGIRPMFESKLPIFETFIFDFSSDIYGKTIRVMPVMHLRAEAVFDGLPALIAQMKEDCIAAAAVLKSVPMS